MCISQNPESADSDGKSSMQDHCYTSLTQTTGEPETISLTRETLMKENLQWQKKRINISVPVMKDTGSVISTG